MSTKSTKHNDPAFPTLVYDEKSGMPNGHYEGITLRDYFAAKAMQAIISNSDTLRECINYAIKDNIESNDEVAFKAYAMADAMLKQREL